MKLLSKPGKITGGEILFNKSDEVIDLVKLRNKEMKKYKR